MPTVHHHLHRTGVVKVPLPSTTPVSALTIAAVISLFGSTLGAQSTPALEYQIKASYLYHFAKMVEWPAEVFTDHADRLLIGIVGKDPFGPVLSPMREVQVGGRALDVIRMPKFDSSLAKQCQVLFICASENDALASILAAIENHHVLSVGEADRFIAFGGVVNFVERDGKIRFEINRVAEKRERLAIGPKLIDLAVRLYD